MKMVKSLFVHVFNVLWSNVKWVYKSLVFNGFSVGMCLTQKRVMSKNKHVKMYLPFLLSLAFLLPILLVLFVDATPSTCRIAEEPASIFLFRRFSKELSKNYVVSCRCLLSRPKSQQVLNMFSTRKSVSNEWEVLMHMETSKRASTGACVYAHVH